MPGQDKTIADKLRYAIHAQKLAETAAYLDSHSTNLSIDDARLINDARRACEHIREQMLKQANELVMRLQHASIPSSFDASDSTFCAPQCHRFRLLLRVGDPTPAIEILKRLGFWSALSTKGLYWESFRRNNSEMILNRIDNASTRLDLCWLENPSTTAWKPGLAFLLGNPGCVIQTALHRISRFIRPRVAPDKTSLGDLLSTPQSLLPKLFSFAEVSQDDLLVDIGCGDGRVLIEAARTTGCRCIGFESQEELCKIANVSIRRERLEDRVKIHHGDAWAAPLADATVVFLFIPVQALGSYLPLLLDRLAPGSRIIAHEQMALECSPEPDRSIPLISEEAITVAHLWRIK